MSGSFGRRTPERPSASCTPNPLNPLLVPELPSRKQPPKSILFNSAILDADVPVPVPVPVPESPPAPVGADTSGMETIALSPTPPECPSVAYDSGSSLNDPYPVRGSGGRDGRGTTPSGPSVADANFGSVTAGTYPAPPSFAQAAPPSSTLTSYFHSSPFFSAFSSFPPTSSRSENPGGQGQQRPADSAPPVQGNPVQQPLAQPQVHPSFVSMPSFDDREVLQFPGPNSSQSSPGAAYTPVHPHWFFCSITEGKPTWFPFSLVDSMNLEEACISGDTDEETLVATDGGRYDVNVIMRTRHAIYWTEEPMPVRRATWFYREPLDTQFTPYDERFAAKLEEEYKKAAESGNWQRRLEFPSGEIIVIHGPNLIVHFPPAAVLTGAWTLMDSGEADVPGSQENVLRPCTVRRGVEDFDISDGEPQQIDHLVFMVHGIGAYCDLRFRGIVECVDDFRDLSLQMMQNHFKTRVESGRVGRIELLPVAWHDALHGDCTGVDVKLKAITLRSIPKLRDLINDTLLDILFYTSPVYCQHIMDRVGSEINRMYRLFVKRHPDFKGHVSIAGHSLGSVILFDLLMHQPKPSTVATAPGGPREADMNGAPLSAEAVTVPETLDQLLSELDLDEYAEVLKREKIDLDALALCEDKDLENIGIPLGPRKKILMGYRRLEIRKRIATSAERDVEERSLHAQPRRRTSTTSVSYSIGAAGTGQPFINYPVLEFNPRIFFAMGSPIALFVTVRGLDNLNRSWKLPTCASVYNIYHPFDPVAYRLESLIDPTLNEVRPVLIPHHKGRKRMHLELKDAMGRVGTEINKFADSIRSTMQSLYQFSPFGRPKPATSASGEELNSGMGGYEAVHGEIAKQMSEVSSRTAIDDENRADSPRDGISSSCSTLSVSERKRNFGLLNGGRRIDYVLQEKPIETVNEYLFALNAHLCYWESEDTILLMVKELYAVNGVEPDETSSAHPLNNRTHQDEVSSAEASAQLPAVPTAAAATPVAITDLLLQQRQALADDQPPPPPFVGVNPASFPSAAPVAEQPLPPVPFAAPMGVGPPPLMPPSSLPHRTSASSVVRPRHYPTVPLPAHLGVSRPGPARPPPAPAPAPAPAPVAGPVPLPTFRLGPDPVVVVPGMDPTAPPSENRNIGPPPISGFVPRHAHPRSSGAATASPALVPVPVLVPLDDDGAEDAVFPRNFGEDPTSRPS